MLETALVKHCAPTLARLKPGNMFVLAGLDGREAAREMRALNRLLAPKGVALTVLRRCGGKTLFYLYRPDELAAILGAEAARAFLRRCGYGEFGSEAALRVLRRRLRAGEGFPHEVGVFLGYPLEDVLGFIRHGGRDCLLCGDWKVYADADGAARTFARFRKCKEVYARLFQSGCPLARLTVAARPA